MLWFWPKNAIKLRKRSTNGWLRGNFLEKALLYLGIYHGVIGFCQQKYTASASRDDKCLGFSKGMNHITQSIHNKEWSREVKGSHECFFFLLEEHVLEMIPGKEEEAWWGNTIDNHWFLVLHAKHCFNASWLIKAEQVSLKAVKLYSLTSIVIWSSTLLLRSPFTTSSSCCSSGYF